MATFHVCSNASVNCVDAAATTTSSAGTYAPCQYFNIFDPEIVDVPVEHRGHGHIYDDISGALDPDAEMDISATTVACCAQ